MNGVLERGGHVAKDATDVHAQLLQGSDDRDEHQCEDDAVFGQAAACAGGEQFQSAYLDGFAGLGELCEHERTSENKSVPSGKEIKKAH